MASTTSGGGVGGSAGGIEPTGGGTVRNAIISNNTAGEDAGGATLNGVKLEDSLVTGNTVTDGIGGGLVAIAGGKYTPGPTRIDNSTVSGNTAGGVAKTKKVKATFSGTDNAPPATPLTFECKVDNEPFDECASPLRLKLDKGRHTLAVRAVDAEGQVDATPVEAKVKVKRAKPKKDG